ncbi:BTB/POZ domain-containing protein [Orchesella cincta]|uniref:BTB/POZ domain-containing protein n=1 Tax=Orchesella cincta TaxID=48709 RepID=A0A1D2MKY9_ORCCI|nr:BTB/POZ domain-containing protein [Orchesella cincta]
MTSNLLKDHEFRVTARSRWTIRIVGDRPVALRDEPLGSEYHYFKLRISTPIDITPGPVEDAFRTILGERAGANEILEISKQIGISFKFSDATFTSGLRASSPPATVTVMVNGRQLDNLVGRNKALKLKVEAVLAIPNTEGEGVTLTIITGEMNARVWEEKNSNYFVETVAIKQSINLSGYKSSVWNGKVTLKLIAGSFDGSTLANLLPPGNSAYKKSLEEELHTDFTIVAENGTKIRAHKMMLAAQSPVFERMLQTDCVESKENECKVKNSEQGVRAFLKYLYYANIDDPLANVNVALELLELGHKYEVLTLENVIKAMFLSVECFSFDVGLALFHRSRLVHGYEDLKAKAVQSIKMRKDQLKDSILFDELTKNDPAMMKELFSLVL